jgi:hypothetical protein
MACKGKCPMRVLVALAPDAALLKRPADFAATHEARMLRLLSSIRMYKTDVKYLVKRSVDSRVLDVEAVE